MSTRSRPHSRNSTNVRMFLLALLLRLAALLSPSLAAVALERLFLTPRRHGTPRRERAWMEGAREHRLRSGEHELAVWSWGDGPPVLLVHGWEGRASQMAVFAAPLVAAGHRAVTFDAPGHGASTGDRSSLPEMARAVDEVLRLLGGAAGVIAHSAGAAATTVALAGVLDPDSAPEPVDRLVYVAPPSDPGRFLRAAGAMAGLPPEIAERTRERIEARFGLPFTHFAGPTLAPGMSAPLLAVHDRGDREVPHAEARQLVAAWPDAELVTTEGLGHRRILRDPDVVRRAVEFVTG